MEKNLILHLQILWKWSECCKKKTIEIVNIYEKILCLFIFQSIQKESLISVSNVFLFYIFNVFISSFSKELHFISDGGEMGFWYFRGLSLINFINYSLSKNYIEPERVLNI